MLKALTGGAGIAHIWTNVAGPLPALPTELENKAGCLEVGPIQVMGIRERLWRGYWFREPDSIPLLRQLLIDLREDAKEEVQAQGGPNSTSKRLDEAVSSFKPTTSRCSYGWSPAEVIQLTDEGKDRLVEFIRGVQRDVCLPLQDILALVAMLGKPLGGGRPVAILGMIYRIMMADEKHTVTGWSEARAGFWDSTIQGNSALQAALIRSLKSETACLLGEPPFNLCGTWRNSMTALVG